MKKISTLLYLLDDTTLPSGTICSQDQEYHTTDELLNDLFRYIEVDPGAGLVTLTIARIKELE